MYYMLYAICFPVLTGLFLLVFRGLKNRKSLLLFTAAALAGASALVVLALCLGQGGQGKGFKKHIKGYQVPSKAQGYQYPEHDQVISVIPFFILFMLHV